MGVMTRVKWREYPRRRQCSPRVPVLLVSIGKSIDKFHADKGKGLEKAAVALEKSVAKYIASIKKKYPAFAEKMRKRFETDLTAERNAQEVLDVKAKLKKKESDYTPEEKGEQQNRKLGIALQVIRTNFPDLERKIAAAKADINNHDKRHDAREKMRTISASLAVLVSEPEYKDLQRPLPRCWTTNSLPQDWDGEDFEATALLKRIKEIEGDLKFIKRPRVLESIVGGGEPSVGPRPPRQIPAVYCSRALARTVRGLAKTSRPGRILRAEDPARTEFEIRVRRPEWRCAESPPTGARGNGGGGPGTIPPRLGRSDPERRAVARLLGLPLFDRFLVRAPPRPALGRSRGVG